MCRMIAAVARDEGVSTLCEILELLPKVASQDHLLEGIKGMPSEPKHCHGYGYIAMIDYGY